MFWCFDLELFDFPTLVNVGDMMAHTAESFLGWNERVRSSENPRARNI